MENKTSLSLVWEDMKIALRFAVKNFISFFLGMIGVLVVTGLIMGVFMGVVLAAMVIFLGGFPQMVDFITHLAQPFMSSDVVASSGMILAIMVVLMMPLVASFFVAIGALFGMSREIVESDGTSVSGVFVWYKTKFFSLAAGGVLLYLTAMVPSMGMWLLAIIVTQSVVLTGALAGVLASFSFIWLVVTLGMLSMMFPAIIDGESAWQAYKRSIRLSTTYFDRVFATWLSFVVAFLIFGITFSFATPAASPPMGPFVGLIGIIGLVLMIIMLPAMSIALTRLYMILMAEGESEEVESGPNDHVNLSLVGGV